MATLRWGIISAGIIAHDFVAALSVPNSRHKITAVAARDVARARDFAKKFAISNVYETYEELISSDQVDIVYVGVINIHHYEISILALEKGKPVLCEKPMAMNVEQALKLVLTAEEKQVFLMEGVWSRFFPVYDNIRSCLRKNTIGQIRQVNLTMGVKIADIPRISQKELGGSSILDLGVYALQFIVLVFGTKTPEIIKAFGTVNNEKIDEYVTCILKYGETKYANLTISSNFLMENTAYIYGTDGMIKVCNPFWKPTKIYINNQVSVEPLPANDYKFNTENASGLLYEADHVMSCLSTDSTQSPLMTHAESLAIAKLQEELRRKIEAYVP